VGGIGESSHGGVVSVGGRGAGFSEEVLGQGGLRGGLGRSVALEAGGVRGVGFVSGIRSRVSSDRQADKFASV